MQIPKEKIIEAKESLGDEGARIIAKDLEIEKWDEKNLKGCCPFHQEDTPSFIWNEKENSFKCFGCGKVYGIIDHYMSFYKMSFLESMEKIFDYANIDFRFGEKGVRKSREYRYPIHTYNEKNPHYRYWKLRKISPETLEYADVQSDEEGNTVFHYYDENDVLVNVKYRPSRRVNKKETKFWLQKDADSCPILCGMNKIDTTKPLLIVEGDPDRLAVIESGFLNVTTIPYGAADKSWIEFNWDFLQQFEKIIIWFDNDEAGKNARRDACSRLGTWRTFFVDVPLYIEKNEKKISVKDVNEILFHFGKEKVIEFIENAQEMPIQSVVNLAEVGDFDIEKAEGLYSGIKEIDKLIYKFVFGSVVILTGSRGSGKSTLLNQLFICEPLNQGYDTFIFSGELTNPILKSWIETTLIGREHIKMKNDFVRTLDKNSRLQMQKWYNNRIWSYDDNNNEEDAILDKAVSLTRRFGVKIWILDNLMTLDIGANDSNVYQKQKDFMVKLTGLAQTYNTLAIVVAHPRKTAELRRLTADDISGANDMSNLAQYIIGVHRYSKKEKEGEKDNHGNYRKGKEPIQHDVGIDFFKNRYTGKIGDVNVFFDYPSYRFYTNPQELYKRYKWNTDTSPIPNTDPNAHEELPKWMKE